MKKILYIVYFFCINITLIAQSSNYFPANNGYVWNYKVTPLDSLGNPNYNLSTARIDSFVTTAIAYNKNSKIILSKNGPIATINTQPYLDTSFVNFEGNIANVYFSIINLDSLAIGDSLIGEIPPGMMQLFNFIKSLTGWYPVYNFSAAVNQTTTLFQKDTTITIDSVSIPLRFSVKSKRLNDESLQTYLGTFTCKKFEISLTISIVVQVLPPPFPPVVYDLIKFPRTDYIALNHWVLKEYMPNVSSTNVPGFDLPKVTIPGYIMEINEPFTNVEEIKDLTINGFQLLQNYPNPFNPETNITFTMSQTSKVKLIISNLLGEQFLLLNNELQPGMYNIKFNATNYNLGSGVYFYSLITNNGVITKKMILIK